MSTPHSIPGFISKQVAEGRYFFLDADPGQPPGKTTRGLRVVCGGYEACEPGYVVDRKTFRYHSIEHVVRGRGRLVLDGRVHELRPGLTYSYGPRCAHEIRADPADPPRKYFIDFTGRSAAAALRDAVLPCGSARDTPGGGFAEIAELLIRHGARPGPETARTCVALLRALTAILRPVPDETRPAAPDAHARQTYRRCRDLLDAHFLRLMSLEELAELCGLAPAYVCRLFRRFEGDTPYRALLRQRMNHAAAALTHSDRMVKQVAHELGYADAYQFSRAFKRVHGVSPSAFKARRAAGASR
ncbi:MAG: AraC family transcriptional regulator [Planctomycetota bacterium]